MNGNIFGNTIVRQDKEKVHQHWYTYQSYSYMFPTLSILYPCNSLVGGFKHFLFFYILGIIIPTD